MVRSDGGMSGIGDRSPFLWVTIREGADALRLPRFAVAGYDWGGRAAAIAAALHPDRVRAAVLIGGYSIQNTLAPPQPGTSTPSTGEPAYRPTGTPSARPDAIAA